MTLADRDESEEERRALASVTKLDVVPREEPTAYQRAPIDWAASEEAGPPPAREWAIDGWLGMDYVTLLSGLGGVGKSVLTQQMATALVASDHFIAPILTPRTVLIWAAEDDENELIRRQIKICQHLGIRRIDLDKRLIIQPLRDIECCLVDIMMGKPMRTSMLKELREQIGDYDADVAMLDNLSCLFGGNENDRHHVREFISALSWAGQPTHAAMLLIGHVSKPKGSEYSGSTAWENAVRARWYFGDKPPSLMEEAEDESVATDKRWLYKRKVNYSSKDVCEMVLDDGTYTILVQPTQGGLVDSISKGNARAVVSAALGKLAAMGIFGSDSAPSPYYLPKLITQYSFNEGLTRRELANATHQLMVEKTIVRIQVGNYSNRTPRFGLALN